MTDSIPSKEQVRRYRFTKSGMFHMEDGQWVSWSDHHAEIDRLMAVAKLASELCDAVDEDAEDIGGHKPVHVILGELGPAVDMVMPR